MYRLPLTHNLCSTLSKTPRLLLPTANLSASLPTRRYSKMNSVQASYKPDASGADPKQLEYLPNLKLNDGHEIPIVRQPVVRPTMRVYQLITSPVSRQFAYGLGTANFKSKDMIGKIDKKVIADTVQAIKCVCPPLTTTHYHSLLPQPCSTSGTPSS